MDRNVPVWKLTDHELLKALMERADNAKVISAYETLKRILSVSAEKNPDLAPGLKAAVGLIDMHAVAFGAISKTTVEQVFSNARGFIPEKAAVVAHVPVTRRRNRTDGIGAKIRAHILSLPPGDFLTIKGVIASLPDADYQNVYMALNKLDCVERSPVKGTWRIKEAA